MGFGKALGRRIEVAFEEARQDPELQARLERGERIIAVTQAAREVASSDLDDASACTALRERLPHDEDAIRAAADRLRGIRTEYLVDRVYRLLSAVLDDAPVRPIDPALADQFLAEAHLGRRSLIDAFEQLAALEPRLRTAHRLTDPAARQSGWGVGRTYMGIGDAEILAGPWAQSPHTILNTELAESIITTYRELNDTGQRPDAEVSTPFVERENRAGNRLGFAVFAREDTRSRATN